MTRSQVCCRLLILALGILAMSFGCARDQQLTSITVHPATATFLVPDPAAQINFTATGTYVHPPETKDITGQVTWSTDIPQLVTINGGVVSPVGGCGVADITATDRQGTGSSGNIITGRATVTVNDPGVPSCPGGGTAEALIVVLQGSGSGTVTSSPAGINCPAVACGAVFTAATTVNVTAVANSGSTFGGWTGCPMASGNICTLTLNSDVTLTATFN